jgi:hypothetical protein
MLVICMRADPEPHDFIAALHTQCAIVLGNSGRVNRIYGMDSLEVEAGILRVLGEPALSLTSLALDLHG